jgi:hypothetical protein
MLMMVPRIAPMKVTRRPMFGISIDTKKMMTTMVVRTTKNLNHHRAPFDSSSCGCSMFERAGSMSSPPGVSSSSAGGSEHLPLYQLEVSIT